MPTCMQGYHRYAHASNMNQVESTEFSGEFQENSPTQFNQVWEWQENACVYVLVY